jgi:hypothetical protein
LTAQKMFFEKIGFDAIAAKPENIRQVLLSVSVWRHCTVFCRRH